MPNIIELLKDDHRGVEQLFTSFESGQHYSTAGKICAELEVHTAAEERFVYPSLREGVSGGDQLADEAEREHAEAKQLIGRVKQTSDPEHLGEVVAELKRAIEHHVQEEEDNVFPKMESDLASTELAVIGANVLEFKEKR